MTAFQSGRAAVWFFTRPTVLGAHAIPLTPSGELILVRLTYARGWRLPGGGRKPGEDPRAAILRELREEIGLQGHGAVEWIFEFPHPADFRHSIAQVFLVRNAAYAPAAWSLEIEEVRAFPLDALPPLLEVTAVQLRMAGLLPDA